MALIKDTLVIKFREIFDSEFSGFKDYPESLSDAANRWADAMNSYGSVVLPSSSTSVAAKAAFMQKILQLESVNDILGISQAVKAYADILGAGMAPAWTGVVPFVGPDLNAVAMMGLNGGTALDCINLLSTLIDSWMRTCTAVNSSSGITVIWS